MAVYTVKVKARPRVTKEVVRRKLKGNALAAAKNARKYLMQAIGHDARVKAGGGDKPAAKLIFLGDADQEQAVNDLIDFLAAQIASKVKTVTVR